MPMIPIQIPPGIVTDSSDYGTKGRWSDGSNMIFINGQAAKRPGFQLNGMSCPNKGVPRNIHTWRANDSTKFVALGTSEGIFIFLDETQCFDLLSTQTISNLKTGVVNYDVGTGYGTGVYGDHTYGTPRPITGLNPDPTNWDMQNFGEDLVFCARGSGIYHWDKSLSDIANNTILFATLINDSAKRTPNAVNLLLVSFPDRHLMAFGVDPEDPSQNTIDPMRYRWAHQETLNEWQTLQNNTAGEHALSHGSEIVAVLQTSRVTLVSTDAGMYIMEFVGPPNTFEHTYLGNKAAAVSSNAMIDVNGIAYWFSTDGFFRFAGGIPEEIPCPMKRFIMDDIDESHLKNVICMSNANYNLITWYYWNGSEQKSVSYNYLENWWTKGEFDCRAGVDANGLFDNPIVFDSTGLGYFENMGTFSGDAFIESAPYEIPSGDNLSYVHRIIPDHHALNGELKMTLSGRKYPSADMIAKPQKTIDRDTKKVDVKLRARQIRLKLEQEGEGHFQVGEYRAEITPDGMR